MVSVCKRLNTEGEHMEPIKLKVVKYSLSTKEPAGKAEYAKIKERCAALGYKLFDCISTTGEGIDKIPEVVTVEPEHLFSNQYNTVEGFRVFDWYESIVINCQTRKNGYYLEGDPATLAALEGLKQSRHQCGYCGKQYDNPTELFCTDCLGSEYLREGELYLLRLLPVKISFGADRAALVGEEAERLGAAYRAKQEGMKAIRATLEVKRLQQRADKLETEAAIKKAQIDHETEIQCKLLRLGIETDNLIYYAHKDEWVFGWREELSNCEYLRLNGLLCEHRFTLGAKFCDSVEWRVRKSI